jgi:glycosyltransferase involved in cell wall biosynthesis
MLVTVCIPTYNGEKFLREALRSVKEQTYRNIEVVISDDNSQDATLQICREFQQSVDFPVFIYNHTPAGIGANWNNCVKNANGEYIKFLFQDDVLLPDCIERLLVYSQKYNLKAVCSKRRIIDENSREITSGEWYDFFGDLQKTINLNFSEFYIFKKKDLKHLWNARLNIFGEPVTFLFKKTLFDEVGFFSASAKQILDMEFCYRILQKEPIGITEKKLLLFRHHAEQTSTKNIQQNIENEYDNLLKMIVKNFFFYLPVKKQVKYLLLRKY